MRFGHKNDFRHHAFAFLSRGKKDAWAPRLRLKAFFRAELSSKYCPRTFESTPPKCIRAESNAVAFIFSVQTFNHTGQSVFRRAVTGSLHHRRFAQNARNRHDAPEFLRRHLRQNGLQNIESGSHVGVEQIVEIGGRQYRQKV